MGELSPELQAKCEAQYDAAYAKVGTPAMINPGWTFSDAPEPEGALRIRLPDQWRAALVRVDAPEIPVTAMAALAPGIGGKGEAERARAEVSDAYRYLRNVFEHVAPQCTPLDDLMGICTQIDNALAGAREEARASGNRAYNAEGRVRELEAERDAALKHCNELERARDGWQAEAAQFHRNQRYYAGLLDQAGELLGPAAMTTDDGTFTGEVLRAKVREVLYDTLATKDSFIDKLTDSNCSLAATNERLRDEISAVTVENAALHDALAPFLARTEAAAKPSGHDPFREFPGDRRRIGG